MTMSRRHLLTYALVLSTISAALQLQAQTPAPTPKPAAAQAGKKATATAAAAPAPQHGDGQRVFEQNCSRCHAAPSGFSPRISGAVAMHMRVRASLSQDDTEALLHFLNP
jgi:cytochrome c5